MSDDLVGPDDDTLARLDDAFDRVLGEVPAPLLRAAHDAFGWRRADAELAELLFDSAGDELVGVRGSTTERRSFRYGADGSVIRVHLTSATMIVMIEPPLSVACRIATEQSTVDARTDQLGELAIDAPDLPVRLEVDLPSGTVVTPWITG